MMNLKLGLLKSVDVKMFQMAKIVNRNGVIYLGDPTSPISVMLGFDSLQSIYNSTIFSPMNFVILAGFRIEDGFLIRSTDGMITMAVCSLQMYEAFNSKMASLGFQTRKLPFPQEHYQGAKYILVPSKTVPELSYIFNEPVKF